MWIAVLRPHLAIQILTPASKLKPRINTSFGPAYPQTFTLGTTAVGRMRYLLPSGDILYVVNLFQQLVAAYGGDAAPISGVLAHEWGHQIQFDNGWSTSSEPTSRPTELEADAFSGFYMALGESYSWTSIDDYFSAVASKGDYNFTDPSHHGTPEERLAAAQLGFQTAIEAIQTQTGLTYADLHQIFSTAISGFDEKQVVHTNDQNSVANNFLVHLDTEQIVDILNGASHGRSATVPNVGNRQQLYPRK
jgi:hypothetical protein